MYGLDKSHLVVVGLLQQVLFTMADRIWAVEEKAAITARKNTKIYACTLKPDLHWIYQEETNIVVFFT